MNWKIITDSSCDMSIMEIEKNGQNIKLDFVPFIITIGGMDYIDDGHVNIEDMLCKMEEEAEIAHTSCPSPSAWMERVDAEENVIMITISKELSGSYNSACVAKKMLLEDNPNRMIAVVNSLSAGPGLATITQRICDEILQGTSFEQIVAIANRIADNQQTIFALSSFDNLVKNGRINKIVGFVAGKLNFWGIGMATKEGTIAVKEKVRGNRKVLKAIFDILQKDIHQLNIIQISHCKNIEMANEIKEMVETLYQGIRVEIRETKALCSFYAEKHGIIISYV